MNIKLKKQIEYYFPNFDKQDIETKKYIISVIKELIKLSQNTRETSK